MANHINHWRRTYRTYEFPRFSINRHKLCAKAPLGYEFTITWQMDNDIQIDFKRVESGLVITNFKYPQKIPITQTQLTYGTRYWWLCPSCGRRCSILYLNKHGFNCRLCVKPSYESQNGYKLNHIESKIRKLRKQLWGTDAIEIDNLFDTSEWRPKPKWMRWHTFNRKRESLLRLELYYRSLWPAYVDKSLKDMGWL